ncbi:hypothetical protein AgCh_038529 [Apium graveolens]
MHPFRNPVVVLNSVLSYGHVKYLLRIMLKHCYMTFAGIHMFYVWNIQLSFVFFFPQELLAIQQQGPRSIGFFGTRNMGFMHQELIEILSYAMVITKNHIFTSGASGTNAAVIRGALRAEKPELLTVILPQSLKMQPPESQELLSKVKNVIEKPYNDHLPLIEASRLCNMDIISHVQQVICFAFHDSRLLMETCQEAKNLRKIVTLFYLD